MSGPSITRIGEVVDALIVLIRAAAPDLDVADGPRIGEIATEAICVGFTDGPDRPGYETNLVRQDGYGRPRMVEEFTVRAFLTISTGDTDPAVVKRLRDRAGQHLAAIDSALRDVHHQPAVWDKAALGGAMEWIPVIDSKGSLVNVFFSVVGASLL